LTIECLDLARKIDRPVRKRSCWPALLENDGRNRELERELGKPVLSTTQVSVWAALRAIAASDGVPGYGRCCAI